jgi:hypothetical protein
MLTAFGVYFWVPSYRSYLFHEDSLIENLSAILYLISLFMAFLFSLKITMYRKALIVLSAVSLLGFLDELSFGERFFELKMLHIYGVKIDAAHDFFYLACKVIMQLATNYSTYVILFLSSGIIIVTVLLLKHRSKLIKIVANIYREPPFILALFFTIFVFISLVIDLDIVNNEILFMVEELFEMNAALALLICCLSLQDQLSSN